MFDLTEKQIKMFKFLDFCGLIFICIGVMNNFIEGVDHPPFTYSLLYPYTNFLVPATNITAGILTLLYLFFPKNLWLIFIAFFMQTLNLISTGFEVIGILLYINSLAFAFAAGLAQKHFIKKTVISFLILFLLIGTLFFEYGLKDGWIIGFTTWIYHLAMATFFIACYVSLYNLLSDKLSFLLGDYYIQTINSKITLPEKGQTLNLESLGLSSRQIACINYTINTSYSYKQIAEKLTTSESTIKKDMQDLFKLFGVKNREMFRLLLMQYNII